MIRFEDRKGRELFIKPGTEEALVPGCGGDDTTFIITNARERHGYTVKGTTAETWQKLRQGSIIDVGTTLQALLQRFWDESLEDEDQSPGSAGQHERVLLLRLAEELGISIVKK